jgi:P-type Ca2+ transporter type 2C
MEHWHQLELSDLLSHLNTDPSTGLSQREAEKRIEEHGPNELRERPAKSPWLMLWEQFTSTTILVLIVAAVVTALLQNIDDTIAILAIVVFNALIGFSQEYKAGKEFAALRKMAVPQARVWRDGEWTQMPAQNLVPGDVIQLEDGDQAPADARLFECKNLRTQESAFTGESESVEKTTTRSAEGDIPLGDRHNMVFMGTVVTYGRAKAIVTSTGMDTELGQIAHSMQSVEQEKTPLQRRLDQVGKRLAIAALVLVTVIFALGMFRGEPLQQMFLTAVSLAVAVIPEGLPAVVTIALALGARRMLKRRALIRKLPAVETLGSVTTICSDKTGTLTENRMTVTILSLAGERVDLRESFAQITSRLDGNKSIFKPGEGTPLPLSMALTLSASALCNNALVPDDEKNNAEQAPAGAMGDPTEIALVVAADRLGLEKEELEELLPRIAEAPFDSDRKMMTTVHQVARTDGHWDKQNDSSRLLPHPDDFPAAPYLAFTKGAVDSLISSCTQVWHRDRLEPLDADWEAKIRDRNDRLASSGTRVLGMAFRPLDHPPEHGQEMSVETDLVFVGLIGMLDPARPEAKEAVATCINAGIRPVMITGDHPLMANHIGKELGITSQDGYLTGQQLNELSVSELEDKVESVAIYARVSPQQKLKIVEALKNRGHIVSMTGDGVNDAPALSKADIGVAMGIAGTDVAKEAADIVLLNDNFATIVAAVEEGRVIYDNIRKFIRYTLTGNTSGVVIMVLAPFIAMPLPLLPIQILWVNLLADGLLALALSVEPAEDNVMQRPPYPPNESIFSRGVGRDILWVGTLLGAALLTMGYIVWQREWEHWQVMIFAALAFSRMTLALAMRSEREFVVERGLFSNRPMLLAVLTTFGLQMAVIYVPWLQRFFETAALSAQELGICLAVSTVGFWAVEIQKIFLRDRSKRTRKDKTLPQ